jgi:DHA1 family bicyclomycin/chloramphenicol resistance-like MFS transporter
MQKQNRSLLIFILGLLAAIGPFSIDMYLPGFPTIAADLHTTVDQVAYSLSSFFIGVCLGQLICGPLLDRFGRKKPLLIGLGIYTLASIGCALSTSIEALVAFRFLQALGGCVGMVAPNAIVRDVFPVNQTARIFSILILILGVSPILAPTAGSYVVATLGWQAVFYISAIVTVLLLLVVMQWLPESRKPDIGISLAPASIAKGFSKVLRVPQFSTHAFAIAIASAGLFAYLAGSPFLFMNLYGVSESEYGLMFGIIAAGLIACSQLNTWILKYFKSAKILRMVLLLQSLTGLILIGGVLSDSLELYSTIVLLFLFVSCQGLTAPNGMALAMTPITQGIGSASALLGALQMVFGAIASMLVGLFFNGTVVPMAVIMACCSIGGLAILLIGNTRMENKLKQDSVKLDPLSVLPEVPMKIN